MMAPEKRKKKEGKKISLQVDMDLVLDVALRKEVYTLKENFQIVYLHFWISMFGG